MKHSDTTFNKTKLLWLFLLLSLHMLVVWGDESDVPITGNETSPPSDSDEEESKDPCLNYECGAYSDASPLDDIIGRVIERKIELANQRDDGDEEEIGAENSPLFLIADVSCAFEGDRVIFDNDSVQRNNRPQNMVWEAENLVDLLEASDLDLIGRRNDVENVTTNLDEVGMDSEEVDISLNVPKDIQIRIYAIDDEHEFKYRSYPCNLVSPILRKMETLEFGNWAFENAMALDFVWNKTAIQEHQSSLSIFHPDRFFKELATLELWVPNKILETTTVMGPKYDYTLAIEVSGALEGNITAPIQASTNTTSNATKSERTRLLTKRPPNKLNVWNNGIGTNVIVSIDTFSIGNITNSSNEPATTELNFLDRSLTGGVKIRTDSNVHGLIQLDGSLTRASVFRDDAPTAFDKDQGILDIQANGFRQVLTVTGNHGTPIALDGIAIALYTTEDCVEDVSQSGNQTACANIAANFTGQVTPNAVTPGATILDKYTFIDLVNHTIALEPFETLVQLPNSCLVHTRFFEYNCNPLSSGGMSVGPVVPSLMFAGSLVAWILAEFLV